MEPIGSRKRKSDEATMSHEELYEDAMTTQRIPTKGAATPQAQESPLKRQRVGITLAQKQALVDNLELEITERARKLRANYNIHAQSLRTRIEIRVNRIPLSLRKLTMGELFDKDSAEQQQQKPSATTSTTRGPPVPAKDRAPSRPPTRGAMNAAPSSSRQPKRLSHEVSGGDKENEVLTPQKKMRAHPAAADLARNPGHVLSPTTSNSRVPPRSVAATPARSGIARPMVTPGRAAAASSILNRMVGDGAARSTTRPTTATGTARKTTTSALSASTNTNTNTTSSSQSAAAAAARRKRGATVTATSSTHHHQQQQPVRPATRTGTTATTATRRASGASETSEGSTGTVVVKRPMTAPPGAQPRSATSGTSASSKRAGGGVMGTIRKGVGAAAAASGTGTGRKTPGVGAGAGKGTGRVLRKRAA